MVLGIFYGPHSEGSTGTELKEDNAGSLGMGLAGSITGGGGGSDKVVPGGNGAPEGKSKGEI